MTQRKKKGQQDVAPKDLVMLERFLKGKTAEELNHLRYLTQNLEKSPQLELLESLAPKTKIKKRPMIKSKVGIRQAFDEEMLAVIENAKENNPYIPSFAEQTQQGEEAFEDEISENEVDAAQASKAAKNARRRERRRAKKQELLVAEKQEKLRLARAKEKAVKTQIAKQNARPVIEDEKKANQIEYLRSGGLTPTEVERVRNWMSTWSKESQNSLYKRMRALSDEKEIEVAMKKLSIEATLRGF